MRTVGIVGCGTIGTALARALEQEYATQARLVALCDRSAAQAHILQTRLRSHPPIVSLPQLIRRAQLVIEAASVSVSSLVAQLALTANRDVLIMSAGGLLQRPALWQTAAGRSRGHLYLPSGALCGLDGVKAMALGSIRRISLTTRKPPRALAGAPGLARRKIQLERLRRATVVFAGSPLEAIRAFPQNTNVAATLTLSALVYRSSRSGRRPKITVRVIADPRARRNSHEVEVEAEAGRLIARLESRPSTENPKTSEMAIRSALVTLKQLFAPVRIGT